VRSLLDRPINYIESRKRGAERPHYSYRTTRAVTNQIIRADSRAISQNKRIKRPGLGVLERRSLVRDYRGFKRPRPDVKSGKTILYRPPILGVRLSRLKDEKTVTGCFSGQR
jgi:hypothetical protein